MFYRVLKIYLQPYFPPGSAIIFSRSEKLLRHDLTRISNWKFFKDRLGTLLLMMPNYKVIFELRTS